MLSSPYQLSPACSEPEDERIVTPLIFPLKNMLNSLLLKRRPLKAGEAAVNSANGFPHISLKELLLLNEEHRYEKETRDGEKREGFVAKKGFASCPECLPQSCCLFSQSPPFTELLVTTLNLGPACLCHLIAESNCQNSQTGSRPNICRKRRRIKEPAAEQQEPPQARRTISC